MITLRGTAAAGLSDSVTINSAAGSSIKLDSTVPQGSPTINLDASSGAGGSLTYNVGSAIVLGNVALPLTITGNGTANFNFTGQISGPMSIEKKGTSTVSFSGLNTYTGTTSVLGGTFLVGANAPSGANGALGNAVSAVLVGATSGSADASLLTSGAFSIGRLITVQAGGTGTVTLGGSTDVNSSFTGAIALNKSVTLSSVTTASNAVTFGGAISGTGFGLTKTGTGTVILSGVNTYTGTTTVSTGTLKAGVVTQAFGGNSAVTVASGATLDLAGFSNTVGSLTSVSGAAVTLGGATLTVGGSNTSTTVAGIISGAGGGLAKTGTGTLTLSGANTFTGTTSVLGGSLVISANAPSGSAGALGNSTSAVLLGATSGTANASLLSSGAVTIARAITVQAGNTGTMSLGGSTDNSSRFSGDIILNKDVTLTTATTGSNTLTFDTGVISGSGGLTKTDAGTIILGGINTYSGVTSVTKGTLRAASTQAFGVGSAVSMTNVAGAVLDLAGFNNSIGSLATGGSLGGNVTLGAATLTVGSLNSSTSYGGTISGTGALTKVGSGTLTLTGINTYTGVTTISAGTLAVSGSAALADTSAVSLANVAGATLLLSGNETVGSITGGGLLGGNVNLGSNTLTAGGDGTSSTFAGVMSGTGGFAKAGAGTLTFSNANTYTGATTLIGGTLALTGGSAIADTSAVSFGTGSTLSTVLVLNASETIGSLATATGVSGTVNLNSFTLTTGGNNSSTSFAGVLAGTGGLTKVGTGGFTLSGANTYTGTTNVNAGTLTLSGGAAIVDTGAVVMANVAGATLALGANETIGSLSGGGALGGNLSLGVRTLTVGDTTSTSFAGVISGTGAFIKAGTGTMTLSASSTYTGATTINGGTLRAGIAGRAFGINSNVTVGAAGTLDLNSFNTTIGTLAGVAGANVTMGSASLVLGGSGNTTYAGSISGTGSLVKTGSGTQTLTGANPYSGTITINAGTLTLGTGGTLNSLNNSTSASLRFVVGGTFNYNVAAGTSQTLNALTFVTGDGILKSTYGGSGTNTLSFTGAPVRQLGGTGTFTASGGTALTNRMTFGAGVSASTLIDKGFYYNGGSSNSYAVYDAAGYVRAYNYTSDVGHAIAGASLGVVTAANNVQMSASISGQLDATLNTLNINNNSNLALASGATLTVDGILKSGNVAGGATISGGLGMRASTDAELVIRTDLSNDLLTISTPILANGQNALTKSGAGTLALTGANTYSGATTINAGIVQIGASSGLGDASVTNTITFNGGTLESTSGNYDLGVNRAITLNATGTIQTTAGTLTVSGNVGDGSYGYSGGNLTKSGGGTLVLSGVNTYTGATSITGGTLVASGGSAIADTSAVTFGASASGTFQITANEGIGSLAGTNSGTNVTLGANTLTTGGDNTTTSFAGIVSGTGGLIKTGAGTQTLSGVSTYTGATTVNGGVLKAGAVAQSFGLNSAMTLANVAGGGLDITGFNTTLGSLAGGGAAGGNVTLGAATLTVGTDSSSTAYAGILSGTGGLTKVGSGTLTLSNLNSYTGATTINAGTLQAGRAQVNSAGAFGNGSAVTLADTLGASLDLAGFSNTIGSLSGGGTTGGNVILGSGTLTVNSLTAVTNYGGVISGTGGLTKSITGNGTVTSSLTLTGTNTYTGATTISGGTLVASGGTAIADTSAVTFGGSASGTLQITANEGIGSLAGTTAGTNVAMGANTLTTGGDNTSTSYAGVVAGTGGFTKVGTGTQTLTGVNTYSGPTTISKGTLLLNNGTAVTGGSAISDSSAVVIANAAATALQLGNSETIGSLSGGGTTGGNVVLGASTLTTGADNSSTSFGGVISGTGGFTKTGSGTQTLSGTETFTGITTVQSGTLALSTATTTNLAASTRLLVGDTSAHASATLDVTGVSNGAGFHVVSGQTASGFGTYNAGAGHNVTVDSGATWAAGAAGVSVGSNAVTGNLVLAGTTDITMGTPGTSHASTGISDLTAVSGSLTLGGTLNLVDNANTGTDGTAAGGSYKIFTQSGVASGSYSGINNIAGTHAVVDKGTSGSVFVDLFKVASASVATPINLPSVHLGGTFGTSGVAVTNLAPNNGFSEGLNASFGTVSGSVSLNGGSISNGQGINNTSMVVGLANANTTVAGHKTGAVVIGLASSGVNSGYTDTTLSNQTVTVNGDVFRLATPNTITSTVNLGYIHQGATFAATSVPITITNGSVNDTFSEGLDTATGTPTGDATASGTIAANMFGSNSAISVGLNTATAGAKSGTVPFNFQSNGTFSVLANTTLATQTVTVLGQVYTGQGVWNNNGGGNWSDVTRWQTLGGSPGLDSQFQTGDTATFGSALISGSATIALNGSSPSIGALTFNNAAASYTVAQGTGGILKLNGGSGQALVVDSAGNHTVSAPIELHTSATITVTRSADVLTVSGPITDTTGSANLTKTGAGTLFIAGTDAHGGATTVTGGTLKVSGSLSQTTSLNLSGGSRLLLANSNVINDAAAVLLSGATIDSGGFSEGTAGTDSMAGNAGMGALSLGASSVLDFSGVGDLLHFAASAGAAWDAGAQLSLYNWSPNLDRLFFGTTSTSFSLTAAQLGHIRFYSDAGTTFLGTAVFKGTTGEVTYGASAVPEASSAWFGGAILGLAGLSRMRRRR